MLIFAPFTNRGFNQHSGPLLSYGIIQMEHESYSKQALAIDLGPW